MAIESTKVFRGSSWFTLPFIYLLVTAILGVFLRFLHLFPLEVKFTNIMHAHSHLALLGWCSSALVIFLVNTFVIGSAKKNKNYRNIFYAFQITVIGMLLFFPSQGYTLTTIVFSSLFIIISYFFAYHFLKDTSSTGTKRPISLRFARMAIWFFLLSSIGPWSLGPLNAIGLGGSDLYFNMIYFYLHFLYNGWFLFSILAFIFAYLERNQISFSNALAKRVFGFLTVSTVLAYALSVLWTSPPKWIYGIGFLAVALQLIAIMFLFKIVFVAKGHLNFSSLFNKRLLYAIAFAFLLKVVLQSFSAFPPLATEIAVTRDWVLAYLHLVFLGIVTPFILLNFFRIYQAGVIKNLSRLGLLIFYTGFLAHEVLMVIKGGTPFLFESMSSLLFGATIFLFLGVLLINLGFFRYKT